MAIIKQLCSDLANRFVVALALFYIAGIITVRLWIEEPGKAITWAAVPVLGLITVLLFNRIIDLYKLTILVVAALCGGAAFFYSIQQPPGSLLEYSGLPAYIEGTVAEEPLFFEDHHVYQLRVEIVETGEGRKPVQGVLLVKLYGENEERFRFGDRLRLRGSIVAPRGQRNPGGFDYRFYLKSQGIDALVYPRAGRVEYLDRGDPGFLSTAAISLRGSMVEEIDKVLPSPSSNLLTAILFGQRDRLPEKIELNFQQAGAGHLLAVSGLHVGLVAAMVAGLPGHKRLRRRYLLVPAIILVFGYAYLTGMRPSALRAAVMISMALGAVLLDRERDLPTAISLAALVTLGANPLLLFGPGFQLSYAATLAIVYVHRPLERLLRRAGFPAFIRSPLAVILAAQCGVMPLCIHYFHHLPAGAVLFNLLLVPLMAFIVGLGLVGALVSLVFQLPGEILLWMSRPLLELMLMIVEWSNLPGFYVPLSPPGVPALILYYLLPASFLLVYYRWESQQQPGEEEIAFGQHVKAGLAGIFYSFSYRKPVLYGAVLLAAVFVLWKGIIFPPADDLRITFIDVGQGASALIEAPCGVVIMVDAGGELPFYGEPGEVGERVLLPLLRRERIDAIDLAVITHPHEDHFGGFIPLVGAVDIGLVLVSPVTGGSVYYEELLEKAGEEGIPIQEVRAGEIWNCGSGLALHMYGPPETLLRGTGSDLNNNSIVFRLIYEDIRVLFTGDIEDAAVRDLFRRDLDLKAEVLQVPHHGGYMAQMPEFLEQVQPLLAVIQVGNNPFGHPHPFVIESLEEAGIQIFRNDHHGAVIIETDGIKLDVQVTEKPAPALP